MATRFTTHSCDGTTLMAPGPIDSTGSSFTLNRKGAGATEMTSCTRPPVAVKRKDGHLTWKEEGATRDAGGPTAGVVGSAPAPVDMMNAPGETDNIRNVFARGTDGNLYQYRLSGANAQKGWNYISYGFGGDPSVTRIPDSPDMANRIAVAEKSSDNSKLWVRIYTDDANGISEDPGQNWIAVAPPPGGFASSPTIAYTGAVTTHDNGIPLDEMITVTALSNDGAIYTTETTTVLASLTGFAEWTMVPGSATSYGTPVMAYTGDRYSTDPYTRPSSTHLFAMGYGGVLWEDACTRATSSSPCSWGGWNKVGSTGQPLGTPLAEVSVAATPTRTYIAATGQDGSLWSLYSDPNADSFGADWAQLVTDGEQPVPPAIIVN